MYLFVFKNYDFYTGGMGVRVVAPGMRMFSGLNEQRDSC